MRRTDNGRPIKYVYVYGRIQRYPRFRHSGRGWLRFPWWQCSPTSTISYQPDLVPGQPMSARTDQRGPEDASLVRDMLARAPSGNWQPGQDIEAVQGRNQTALPRRVKEAQVG